LQIGAVLEESRLIEEASVGYNLRCAGLVYGLRGPLLEGRVRMLFKLLEWPQNDPSILKAKVCTLNQSLKRKLLVLRECLGVPGLLVFDRPLETLGPSLGLRFLLSIQEATQKPTSLLLSVQDPKTLGVLKDKASIIQLG
jgi:ABC-type multidrug transport system ATPase subunit